MSFQDFLRYFITHASKHYAPLSRADIAVIWLSVKECYLRAVWCFHAEYYWRRC